MRRHYCGLGNKKGDDGVWDVKNCPKFLRQPLMNRKAAHLKMLVKSIPVVNFINVIRAHFLYEFFNKAKK